MCTTTSTTTTKTPTTNDNNTNINNNNVSSTSTATATGTRTNTNTIEIEIGKRYIILRNFIKNEQDQINIVKEIIDVHERNNGINLVDTSLESSKNSITLNLGIKCGNDLSTIVPLAISMIRKVFHEIVDMNRQTDSLVLTNDDIIILQKMSNSNCSLCGLSLLYSLQSSMKSHYDSSTQIGQTSEWLGLLSFGNTILYQCNNSVIPLHSGDVLVMDSMSVLHGINKVVDNDTDTTTNTASNSSSTEPSDNIPIYKKLNLPFPSRLGILFWQGKSNSNSNNSTVLLQDTKTTKQQKDDDEEMMIGISDLFI